MVSDPLITTTGAINEMSRKESKEKEEYKHKEEDSKELTVKSRLLRTKILGEVKIIEHCKELKERKYIDDLKDVILELIEIMAAEST